MNRAAVRMGTPTSIIVCEIEPNMYQDQVEEREMRHTPLKIIGLNQWVPLLSRAPDMGGPAKKAKEAIKYPIPIRMLQKRLMRSADRVVPQVATIHSPHLRQVSSKGSDVRRKEGKHCDSLFKILDELIPKG
jgi:hypothetical protein